MRAGLGFRVGFADEPLPKRGITHLLEHLALHTAGVADYHYNGATGVEHTYFHMQGSEDDIATFLKGVCSSLLDLPVSRLATEKEILRVEAAGRRTGASERMPMWRHGARDYGMTSYPEWGLAGITEDDLRAWVARYFVRQNAVLWVTGPQMPSGLHLVLPDGERQPVPSASSALPERPAYFNGSAAGIVWDSVVPREPAAAIFAGVLERQMFRALRQESGLSYTVAADYEPRADGTAVITAVADSLAEKQGAVLGEFVDVLAAMRVGRIEQAEVDAVIAGRCAAYAEAEEQGGRLPSQAFDLLAGRPVRDLAEMQERMRAVTREDVVRVAREAYADGLMYAPGQETADWAGFTAAPRASGQAVTGQAYPSLDDPHARLIFGAEGASFVDDELDETVTVRFDACAVMLAWPDGGRQLIGTDAVTLRVEPTLFHGVPGAVAWLDAQVAADLRVEMPAREAIPQPQQHETVPPVAVSTPRPSPAGPVALLAVLMPLSGLLVLFGVGGVATAGDPGVETLGTILMLSLIVLLLPACGWGIYRAIRRLRGW